MLYCQQPPSPSSATNSLPPTAFRIGSITGTPIILTVFGFLHLAKEIDFLLESKPFAIVDRTIKSIGIQITMPKNEVFRINCHWWKKAMIARNLPMWGDNFLNVSWTIITRAIWSISLRNMFKPSMFLPKRHRRTSIYPVLLWRLDTIVPFLTMIVEKIWNCHMDLHFYPSRSRSV